MPNKKRKEFISIEFALCKIWGTKIGPSRQNVILGHICFMEQFPNYHDAPPFPKILIWPQLLQSLEFSNNPKQSILPPPGFQTLWPILSVTDFDMNTIFYIGYVSIMLCQDFQIIADGGGGVVWIYITYEGRWKREVVDD